MTLSHRFTDALVFAVNLHSRQLRKGSGVPYAAHLLGVCSLVLEDGGSEDEAVAALLHDAIEDQGGEATEREIRRRFGEFVAEVVVGCTDSDVHPKPPWRPRKERFVASLTTANPSVLRVVAADKLHNARALLLDHRTQGRSLWSRFSGGREGTLWYYRAVADALWARREAMGLVGMLMEAVQELEKVAGREGKMTDPGEGQR